MMQPFLAQLFKVTKAPSGTVTFPRIVEELVMLSEGINDGSESQIVMEMFGSVHEIMKAKDDVNTVMTDKLCNAVEYFVAPIIRDDPRSVFRKTFCTIHGAHADIFNGVPTAGHANQARCPCT